MNSLSLQDTVEPSREGRKNTFASIEPTAVERAHKLKDRIEEARKARLAIEAPAGEDAGSEG
jgi:hypothetical protein